MPPVRELKVILNDIFISGNALWNRSEQFKVYLDTRPTQLCRSKDTKQKFERYNIEIICFIFVNPQNYVTSDMPVLVQ